VLEPFPDKLCNVITDTFILSQRRTSCAPKSDKCYSDHSMNIFNIYFIIHYEIPSIFHSLRKHQWTQPDSSILYSV